MPEAGNEVKSEKEDEEIGNRGKKYGVVARRVTTKQRISARVSETKLILVSKMTLLRTADNPRQSNLGKPQPINHSTAQLATDYSCRSKKLAICLCGNIFEIGRPCGHV